MTEAVPWIKWRFDKWRGDSGLRMCSLAARGLWIDLLTIMHECNPYGHLTIKGRQPTAKQIASLVGMTTDKEVTMLLDELEEAGVFSRKADGTIYSRRMERDNHAREASSDKLNGSLGGNPNIIRGTVPKDQRVRPFRRSDSPEKTERIFNRTNGHCHWCEIVLQRNHPGIDFFVVDHVVAVRDGGTNDEENLVAACSECNGKRAVIGYSQPNPTATYGLVSDGSPTATGDPPSAANPTLTKPKPDTKAEGDKEGNGDGERIEKKESANADSGQLAAAPTSVGVRKHRPSGSEDVDQIVTAWNEMAARAGLSPIIRLTSRRRRELTARLQEHGVAGVVEAIGKIGVSNFCLGGNDRGWKADFDFLLQDKSLTRTREGKYDNRAPGQVPSKATLWDRLANDSALSHEAYGIIDGECDEQQHWPSA